MTWCHCSQDFWTKDDTEAKNSASFFLQSINSEAVIQIAMMCDAAQEELELSPV
jgi:hypothetical protein